MAADLLHSPQWASLLLPLLNGYGASESIPIRSLDDAFSRSFEDGQKDAAVFIRQRIERLAKEFTQIEVDGRI